MGVLFSLPKGDSSSLDLDKTDRSNTDCPDQNRPFRNLRTSRLSPPPGRTSVKKQFLRHPPRPRSRPPPPPLRQRCESGGIDIHSSTRQIPVYSSETPGVSGNESHSVDTNVEATEPQESRLEQTQVVDELNITDTECKGEEEEDKEEAPPLPTRTRGRRHRYEETVILFRPIIVRDVIVSQILPHLQVFLTTSDISAIKGENDQHKAVEVLLDKLSTCQEPGKWKMFVQALEKCKYQAIVDALKRKSVPDSNEPEQVLRIFSPKLREMIIPSEIIEELLRTDVINSDDRNEIHQKERCAGAVAAADLLLDRIPRKNPDWFENFLIALRSIDRQDLVDLLTLQTDTSPATERNDIQSGTANSEDEVSESNNDLTTEATKCKNEVSESNNDLTTEATKCKNNQILDTEQQTTNEQTEDDEYAEYKNLVYSGAYENVQVYEMIQEPFNQDDETTEKKTLDEADRSLQRGKRRVKYTPDVRDEPVCKVIDESETEDRCQFENVQRLREKKNALVTEGNELQLELIEYEGILKAHEKRNELLSKKRSFCEQVDIKEKEAAALKAAISGENIEEDRYRYQSATCLEDTVQYIAPGRRAMTLDYRDPSVTTTAIPSGIPTDTRKTMPVKLFDVEQDYKDSAFYSDTYQLHFAEHDFVTQHVTSNYICNLPTPERPSIFPFCSHLPN